MLQFEFDGHNSSEYGIIMTGITDNDNLESRSLQLGEKNRYRARENHFGTVHGDNYSFTLSIMKNPCTISNSVPSLRNGVLVYEEKYLPTLINNTLIFPMGSTPSVDHGTLQMNDTYYLSSNNVRSINSWLMSPQVPRLFKIIGGEYFSENIEFFVTFTEVTTEHTSSPYEMSFTAVCDAPYGYTPEITYNITSSSTITRTCVINNTSDCYEDYIYPLIKISPKSHGTITIQNVTDNNGTMKISALKDDDFYIDCQHLKIYDITNSIISFEDLGVKDIDNIYWLRLAYGENELRFTGDATFELIYREPRKVGAFG